jgi:hypothetical protein
MEKAWILVSSWAPDRVQAQARRAFFGDLQVFENAVRADEANRNGSGNAPSEGEAK